MAKQVLVIDDDRNFVKCLSVALSEHGYEPVSACDGNDGLRKILQTRPDLVVLDVMMPGKSGFILLKQLKKDEQLRDIPVIMLSGVGGVLDELERRQDEAHDLPRDSLRESLRKKIREMRENGALGPQMFIDKPVKPDFFISKVRQLIGS
jgi:CheY-like chemotaxis protein